MSKKHKKTTKPAVVSKTPPVVQPASTKEVCNHSIEGTVIVKKLKDLQVKYRTAMKTKQELTQKLRILDEEITKMVGAHTTLMELKVELEKDVVPVKTDGDNISPTESNASKEKTKDDEGPVKDTGKEDTEPTKGTDKGDLGETEEKMSEKDEQRKEAPEEKEEKTHEGVTEEREDG